MNKQIKDILGMLLIVVPFMAGIVIWWQYSPMYHNIINSQRQAVQNYLIRTYYYSSPYYDKKALMNHYGFTDEDINPVKLLNRWIDENAD